MLTLAFDLRAHLLPKKLILQLFECGCNHDEVAGMEFWSDLAKTDKGMHFQKGLNVMTLIQSACYGFFCNIKG